MLLLWSINYHIIFICFACFYCLCLYCFDFRSASIPGFREMAVLSLDLKTLNVQKRFYKSGKSTKYYSLAVSFKVYVRLRLHFDPFSYTDFLLGKLCEMLRSEQIRNVVTVIKCNTAIVEWEWFDCPVRESWQFRHCDDGTTDKAWSHKPDPVIG